MATYDDLRARASALPDQFDRPPIIAISGHGGAGKSTMAARLSKDLGQSPDQVVGMDELYAPVDYRQTEMWKLHDWPELIRLLTDVREGGDRLRFSWRYHHGREGVRDEPLPRVVIVEGIRLLRPETLPLFDLSIWLDLDPHTAGQRAKARNLDQGDDEAELALWDSKWIPEGETYERDVRPQDLADLVIPTA